LSRATPQCGALAQWGKCTNNLTRGRGGAVLKIMHYICFGVSPIITTAGSGLSLSFPVWNLLELPDLVKLGLGFYLFRIGCHLHDLSLFSIVDLP